MNASPLDIETGTYRHGSRWASCREWLLTAYREGGYERFRRVPPFGFLVTLDMPKDIEQALCAALGIPCEPD
jgi:hypothetical protein